MIEFIKFYDNPKREHQEESDVLVMEDEVYKIVLWNDDVNTFDFVIECLIEICEHTPEQAEQCTILVHYKGKCTVKSGSMEKLKPMHEKLLSRGLTSEIV
ncbi:ATP-dependent Clp protease adaptor ClpS [uncultured Chryseobacterium sp.]|uniref:ATP-dependent Clp protease adaptor ClpS n=1 Tax=uncultured Chryseobacterium sp. TaxID=259322 RepID=UPI002624A76E|nr:ATP-dependent Clp protease adaptor ClpS [uncultured Chryseobacterium sp.]